MKPKILICYKNTKVIDPNACHIGMGVTSINNRKFLYLNNIEANVISVIDGYDLRNLLNQKEYRDVTHVVISAPFFDTGFLKQLCYSFPTIKFTITFHSNSGFLGLDKWAMGMLGELIEVEKILPNFKISVNSEKFAKTVNEIFKMKILVLPNLYPFNLQNQYKPRKSMLNVFKIGCFSAIRSLKNIPTAAFAAAIYSQQKNIPVEFHIVVGRNEDPQADKIIQGIENLFKHIPNIKLIKNEWRESEDFHDLVKDMNILFMPSFTESFNNVTADAISNGVPVIVSSAIDWLPTKFVANSDDAYDIVKVADNILRDSCAVADGMIALEEHNNKSLKIWKSFIGIEEDTIFVKIKKLFKNIFRLF